MLKDTTYKNGKAQWDKPQIMNSKANEKTMVLKITLYAASLSVSRLKAKPIFWIFLIVSSNILL